MGEGVGKILVVEDHDDTRRAVEKYLEFAGYLVRGASSKTAAMALCAQEEFELLVCDLTLPDGNGLDIMRELAARYRIRGIACTGDSSELDVEAAHSAGFSAHLTKPISLPALVETIEKLLAEQKR